MLREIMSALRVLAGAVLAMFLMFAALGVYMSSQHQPEEPAPQAEPAPPALEGLADTIRESVAAGDHAGAARAARLIEQHHPDHPDAAPTLAMAAESREIADREAAEAAAERRRQQEQRRLAGLWSYSHTSDPMGQGTSRSASIRSSNTVNLDFPYQGAQHGTLILRVHPRYGRDAILSLAKGQISCPVSGCNVLVRFDDGPAQTFRGNRSNDGDSTVIFIGNYDRFRSALRRAKRVRIQPPLYRHSGIYFDFSVAGYDAERHARAN